MKRITIACVIIVLSSMCTCAVAQESEDETRYLISITNEIENLKALARNAEANADIRARTRFDYVALQHDLEQIQQAIERHVQQPSRTPRSISALSEHYTRKVTDD